MAAPTSVAEALKKPLPMGGRPHRVELTRSEFTSRTVAPARILPYQDRSEVSATTRSEPIGPLIRYDRFWLSGHARNAEIAICQRRTLGLCASRCFAGGTRDGGR